MKRWVLTTRYAYAEKVQDILNKEAGIGLKSIQAPINQKRIDGLVNRLSYEEKFDDVSWILKEPIVNFNQNIVDNHIKVNADFHFKSGLKPKIVRTTDGNCCEWCSKIAGVYTYPGVNRDVFRRHDRCTCTVDYHQEMANNKMPGLKNGVMSPLLERIITSNENMIFLTI